MGDCLITERLEILLIGSSTDHGNILHTVNNK